MNHVEMQKYAAIQQFELAKQASANYFKSALQAYNSGIQKEAGMATQALDKLKNLYKYRVAMPWAANPNVFTNAAGEGGMQFRNALAALGGAGVGAGAGALMAGEGNRLLGAGLGALGGGALGYGGMRGVTGVQNALGEMNSMNLGGMPFMGTGNPRSQAFFRSVNS